MAAAGSKTVSIPARSKLAQVAPLPCHLKRIAIRSKVSSSRSCSDLRTVPIVTRRHRMGRFSSPLGSRSGNEHTSRVSLLDPQQTARRGETSSRQQRRGRHAARDSILENGTITRTNRRTTRRSRSSLRFCCAARLATTSPLHTRARAQH